MSLAISIAFALAVLLIFDGLTSETARSGDPRRWRHRVRNVGATVASAALAAVVAFAVGSSFPLIVTVGVTAGWLPSAWRASRLRRSERAARERWPECLGTLIASIRGGRSLPEAVLALCDASPAGSPLDAGFAAFRSTYRATGSFSASLRSMRLVHSDAISDRVAVSLELAHDVGGTDLVRVLVALADQVRAELHVQAEIEARWAWTVTAARVGAAAPWIVLGLMLTRPEARAAFATPTGGLVVAGGALVTLLGYRSMLRAGRLPTPRRLG